MAGCVASEGELSDAIDAGKAKAAIIIPSDYAKELKRNNEPQAELIIDGSDPTTARTALNSGLLISQIYSLDTKSGAMKKLGVSAAKLPGVGLNMKVWSIGMLISTSANNQLQAMMVMVLVLLPSILLSGFIFPREAMSLWSPPWATPFR